ncbi:hypothetical protein B2J69_08290 [Pantoea latae]|uniref:Uncharacterized protein n=1 Tax=Pantoea latae TaxID=1964541 RepID=A0A1V9DLT6_9GAMM|nr:hypothetical protein B2J69_08290 [Pantoea latae]
MLTLLPVLLPAYAGFFCPSCFPVIFCAAAALAALGYPGHILMYAPGDILACRLASAQKL